MDFLRCVLVVAFGLLTPAGLVLGQCPRDGDERCSCMMQESVIRIYQCDNLGVRDGLPYLGETDDIIQVIQISSSTVRNIYNDSFAGLKTRTLDLRRIGIEHLDVYAFAGLGPTIENVYLVDNEIQTLPFAVFKDLVYLRTLTLDRNALRSIVAQQFSGLVRLTHLGLASNSIEALEAEAFRGIPSTKYLYLQSNQLKTLPLGIFDDLVNLEELNLIENHISTLHPDVLSKMPLLQQLYLSNNKIEGLPESLFDKNKNLDILDMDDNLISSELTNRHFVGPRLITFLDLSFNNLTTFHPSTFHNMKHIKKLYLDNNKLTKLAESTFEGLDDIEELYIQNNLIEELPQNTFVGMPNLRVLDLSRNQIQSLGFGIFDPFGLLEKLDLSRNKIRFIEYGPFITVRSLVSLDLSWNQLKGVGRDWFAQDDWLGTVKPLKELFLNNNAIRKIDTETLWPLKNLERLDISSNRLVTLNASSFRALSALTEIKMHDNPLHNISAGLFSNLLEIKTLDLSGTCLTEVVAKTFEGMTALEDLNLSNGFISSVSPEAFRSATRLSTLNLAHNNLTSLERPVFTLIANSLEVLQLDHNALTTEGLGDAVDFVTSLKVLDISFNRLSNVYGPTNLQSRGVLLKIRSNPIQCDCFVSWLRNYPSLGDFENLVCDSPAHVSGEYAVCFPFPNQCNREPVHRMYVDFCANPPRLETPSAHAPNNASAANNTNTYRVKNTRDYVAFCVEPDVPLTTAAPDAGSEEDKDGLPGALDIRAEIDGTSVLISWPFQNNSKISGFTITCREFGENVVEKEYSVLDATLTDYSLTDLTLERDYVVCVYIILDDQSTLRNARSCVEITLRRPTTKAPKDELKPESFPLMPVIGTCIAVVVVLVVILAVVILCLKRKPKEDEGKYMDERLRDKMGMWVNSFNYNGGVNEQIAEQTTVEVDIFAPVDVVEVKKNGTR